MAPYPVNILLRTVIYILGFPSAKALQMFPVALFIVSQAMTVLSVPTLVYHNHQAVLDAPTDWQARLPVPNPTHSFWINTPGANPLAAEGSEGPLTSDADVCIIGSGITGVSSAYHLSKSIGDKPLKVVILEARDFCESRHVTCSFVLF